MSYVRSALLVAPTTQLSNTLAKSIRDAGYRLTVVKTFAAAKQVLSLRPDVLITELKLADYNGLHLALRGRTMGIPSIVVAEKDFEHEVEQLGAVWLSPESSEGEDLQITLTRLTQDVHSTNAMYPWFDGAATEGPAAVSSAALLHPPDSRGLFH
jgi:DNA-binding NtrC family response regulator